MQFSTSAGHACVTHLHAVEQYQPGRRTGDLDTVGSETDRGDEVTVSAVAPDQDRLLAINENAGGPDIGRYSMIEHLVTADAHQVMRVVDKRARRLPCARPNRR
ncbi:hypothetical protein [Catellatospora sichuanensis]|uniref:hypothetical protein n=1 Tax=Catellatospora sichuanensis TaxID=1969805 RepID=UPI0011836094|nr:hypothetical protein [Catellatospora sichuanensis]